MVARTAPGGFIPDPFVLCGGPEGVVARCRHPLLSTFARICRQASRLMWPTGQVARASPHPPAFAALAAIGAARPLAASAAARDVPRQRSRPARHTRPADLRPVATVALCRPPMTGDWHDVDPSKRSMTRPSWTTRATAADSRAHYTTEERMPR